MTTYPSVPPVQPITRDQAEALGYRTLDADIWLSLTAERQDDVLEGLLLA